MAFQKNRPQENCVILCRRLKMLCTRKELTNLKAWANFILISKSNYIFLFSQIKIFNSPHLDYLNLFQCPFFAWKMCPLILSPRRLKRKRENLFGFGSEF